MTETHDIPEDLAARFQDEDPKTREDMFARARANDPEIRRLVRQALEEEGFRIDPMQLEFAIGSAKMWDADSADSIQSHWEKRDTDKQKKYKEELGDSLRKFFSELDDVPREEWRSTIFSNIGYFINYGGLWGGYLGNLLHKGPDWDDALNDKLEYQSIITMLDNGEDPRVALLILANQWGNRTIYRHIADNVGADLLLWDDRRSLLYNHLFSPQKQDIALCDEIHIDAAGLASIEPWIMDRDIDYDMYGSTIAKVSTYSVAFVPSDPKQVRILQKRVDDALRILAKTEFPFDVPGAHYDLDTTAYVRPEDHDSHESSKEGWREFLERQKTYQDQIFETGEFEALEKKLREENIEKYWDEITDTKKERPEWLGHESGYLCHLHEKKLPLPDYVPEWFLKALSQHQDSIDDIRHTSVDDQGRVVLKNQLALDDVWDLYRISRSFVEPSEQIATAMNAARFAEERGPLQQKEDIASSYGYNGTDPRSTMGNLHAVPEDERLVFALAHIAMMAGMKEVDPQVSLAQVVGLSDATLKGHVPDPTGLFPTYKALTDQREGGAIVSYDEVAGERARSMLDAITVMFGQDDLNIPLRQRFDEAVKNARKMAIKERLVAEAIQQYRWDQKMRDFSSYLGNGAGWLGENAGREAALKMSDVLSGNFERFVHDHVERNPRQMNEETGKEEFVDDPVYDAMQTEGESAESKRKFNAVTNRAGLVKWGGKVPPQIDRSYDGTNHVTRSHHSPYARLELPDDLAPFIRQQQKNAHERRGLPDPNTIFGSYNA